MRTFASLALIKLARIVFWLSSKLRRVTVAYFLSRFIATFVFSDIESWKFLEAMWWTGVASQTIGYGDLAPKTDIGRLVAEPFHAFWTFYCLPLIAGHVVIYLFKNLNVFTHLEQEWLFKTVRITFDWVRWCVQALQLIAARSGVELPKPPHGDDNGVLVECEEEPADTDYDDELVGQAAQIKAK